MMNDKDFMAMYNEIQTLKVGGAYHTGEPITAKSILEDKKNLMKQAGQINWRGCTKRASRIRKKMGEKRYTASIKDGVIKMTPKEIPEANEWDTLQLTIEDGEIVKAERNPEEKLPKNSRTVGTIEFPPLTSAPEIVIQGEKSVAVINDTHHPYQDAECLTVVEECLKDLQPDYLVYNGDMCDFYQISKFDKNPSRLDGLQSDINSVREMFDYHSKILPNTIKYFIVGNHEERLRRYLWTTARELSSLEELHIEKLLHLKDYGIQFVEYEKGLPIKATAPNGVIETTFLVTHGTIVRKFSSYTAKGMYDREGISGISGHTHRQGMYRLRNRRGDFAWWENYCLCDLDPDYVSNPDWHQGFSMIYFNENHFDVKQMNYINGKIRHGEVEYGHG